MLSFILAGSHVLKDTTIPWKFGFRPSKGKSVLFLPLALQHNLYSLVLRWRLSEISRKYLLFTTWTPDSDFAIQAAAEISAQLFHLPDTSFLCVCRLGISQGFGWNIWADLGAPLSLVLSFLRIFHSIPGTLQLQIPILFFQASKFVVSLWAIFCANWEVFSEGKLDKCRVYFVCLLSSSDWIPSSSFLVLVAFQCLQ